MCRIGTIIKKKEFIEKNMDKMPLTKACIKSIEKDTKIFRIRKIKWAIKELLRKNIRLNVTNVSKEISLKR